MCNFQECWLQVKRLSRKEKLYSLFFGIVGVCSFLLFFCLLTSKSKRSLCYTPECLLAVHHVLSTVDQTADPCDDFYKFACGKFLKNANNAIAYDQVNPLKALDFRKKTVLKQLVMEDRKDERKLTKSFRDQRKFFRSCMNTSEIEEDKDKTFLDHLKYVTGGWPLSLGYALDIFLPDMMIRAREKGLSFNHFLDIDTKVDLNSGSIYLEVKPPPRVYYDTTLWREVNIQTIGEMAEYWGNHSINATWEVRKTIEFAENLNKIVEKTYNATRNLTIGAQKTKISQLKNLHFPKIPWLQFLKNMTGVDSLKDDDVVLFKIDGDEYFKDLSYLLQKTHTTFWINYVVILLIIDDCRSLSKKIEASCKEILNVKANVTRKDYCFNHAIRNFDGVAEAQYIRQFVTKEKRAHIKHIIDGVKKEMEENLKKNKWMDKQTKDAAVEHLRKITAAIGWTDIVFNVTEYERLFSYNERELSSDNIIEITHELNRHYLDYRFKKIEEPFSFQMQHTWSVPILNVNAYYVKSWDILILVAPILNQPVYAIDRTEYLNYGALGSIIGHELTHAFSEIDEVARQTFGKGITDFWTNKTHENYDVEKECINEEYENYSLSLGVTLADSSVFMDENLADFTGSNLAYKAYQKWVDQNGIENQLPGIKFTPNQLFWIMSSTYMCKDPKLEDPERMHTHALASFRVNGPIRNSPYFADDFGCRRGSKMNPEKKCRLFV